MAWGSAGSAVSSPRLPSQRGGSLHGGHAGMCCFSRTQPLSPGSLHESRSLVLILELRRSSIRIRLHPVPHLPEPGCKCPASPRAAPALSWQRQRSRDARPSSGSWRGHRVSCATASLCPASSSRERPCSVVLGCREVKLAPLKGLRPKSRFLVACRGREGFVADVKCTVLLAREGYFAAPQITNVSASRRVQPAVGAALASCRAWLCVDPAGKGALAPFASSPPSAEAPAAPRSAFPAR